jgi:hypothetical protein
MGPQEEYGTLNEENGMMLEDWAVASYQASYE